MIYVAPAGVALATVSAWRAHDAPLAVFGVAIFVAVGAGAIYVAIRRR